MERFDLADTIEIHRALELLTQEKGIQVQDGDVVVKRKTSRSGNLLYVIVAMSSGVERAVGNVLASVMMRLTSGPIGIWALRREEVDQLLLNADAVGTRC